MAQDRNPAVWPHFDKSKVPYVNEHICQCWWGRWWWWWSIRKPSAPTYLYLPGRIVSFKSSPLFSSLLFFSGGYISFKSSGRRFVSFLFFLLKHVHPPFFSFSFFFCCNFFYSTVLASSRCVYCLSVCIAGQESETAGHTIDYRLVFFLKGRPTHHHHLQTRCPRHLFFFFLWWERVAKFSPYSTKEKVKKKNKELWHFVTHWANKRRPTTQQLLVVCKVPLRIE